MDDVDWRQGRSRAGQGKDTESDATKGVVDTPIPERTSKEVRDIDAQRKDRELHSYCCVKLTRLKMVVPQDRGRKKGQERGGGEEVESQMMRHLPNQVGDDIISQIRRSFF